MRVLFFVLDNTPHNLLSLLSDAELAEYPIQDVLCSDCSGDFSQQVSGPPEVKRLNLKGESLPDCLEEVIQLGIRPF